MGDITPVRGYQFAGTVYTTLAEAEKAKLLHKASNDWQDAVDQLGEELGELYERNAHGYDTASHFVGMASEMFPFTGASDATGFFEALDRARDAYAALQKARQP